MPALPTLPSITGGTLTTSELAQIVAALQFEFNRPVFEARQTVAQSFTTAVGAAFTWATPDVDNVTGWVVGTPSRYTAQYPGRYGLGGGASWVANVTGLRECWWAVNGVAVNGSLVQVNATSASGIAIAARFKTVFLNIGDFVELFGLQNAGGPLNSSVSSNDQPNISIVFLGAQ